MHSAPGPATPAPPIAPTLTPVQATSPVPPSVHVRAVITWLAIFPLVALGMMASTPLMDTWHPVLRALALTLVVVPTAVYVGVPRMLGAYGSLVRRRSSRG